MIVVKERVVMELSKAVRIDEDNSSIKRVKERCIDCGRCKTICRDVVGISYDKKCKEAVCINCGQCILNCPVGALVPKYDYKRVLDYLHDTEKLVTISVAPAVRTSIGEGFGLEPGIFLEKELVGALKEVGFDYVFDVTFGADMTVMEEAYELVDRLKNKKTLPIFTSCCPSWVKYLEIYHPDKLSHLSTVKSPIGIQSSVINTYFLKMMNIPKEKIVNVVVAPCTAKKYEIKRTELGMDICLTTSELVLLLKESNIDIKKVKPKEFDSLLSKGSGAGLIFGRSGGVLESVLRCANYIITGKDKIIDSLALEENKKCGTINKAMINIGTYKLRVASIQGMKSVEEVLKDLDSYDFIEVMNCPLGCVSGGGQVLNTISKMDEINKKRAESLEEDDKNNSIRFCYKNPDVINIYKTYLDYPNSPKALKLIHTKFKDRSSILRDLSL